MSSRPTAERWRAARRILAVRLDTIGDVLMTTPAIRALKNGAPDARVTLLTSAIGAQAARLVPEVDEVIVYDAPWLKATGTRSVAIADRAMILRLRAAEFDAAAIFTVYSQSPFPAAMLCYLADIPLRLAHSHENPYQLLTDWVEDPEPASLVRHEVRRQLDLVTTVGFQTPDERLSLQVPAEARRRAEALLTAMEIKTGESWVLIHVGATASSRRYPPELFAELADRIVWELGCAVVISGGPREDTIVRDVRARMRAPSRVVLGTPSLAEFAALIAAAPLLISNNSGPVHIAAAVGTPIVDLYALTNPQHTPWRVPHRVLSYDVPCKWCYRSVCPEGHQDCLRQIRPGDVVAAAAELLSETSSSSIIPLPDDPLGRPA